MKAFSGLPVISTFTFVVIFMSIANESSGKLDINICSMNYEYNLYCYRQNIWTKINPYIFANILKWRKGHSSFRHKRHLEDLKEFGTRVLDVVNDEMGGSFGVGDICGSMGVKDHAQCNEISVCDCESMVCKCVLSWWFILSIVLLVLLIVGLILCCVLRALGCCCN